MLSRAAERPERLAIGLDANAAAMAESSAKAARGELANVLFARAAVEALPEALRGRVDSLTVNLPWGTLLGAVLAPDTGRLAAIRAMCTSGAQLAVVASWDASRDATELARLGVELEAADGGGPHTGALRAGYAAAGFRLLEVSTDGPGALERLPTTWAKRLRGNRERMVIRLVAEACD